jgi:hypothetical protein
MRVFWTALFCLLCVRVRSFATYLTEHACNTPIEVGTEMMGFEVVFSEDKVIKAKRKDEVVLNGTIVDSLDGIEFEIDPNLVQSIMEVRTEGISFVNGLCEGGKRQLRKGRLVKLTPTSDSSPLEIRIAGAWGTSFRVKKTADFILYLNLHNNEL